MEAVTIRRTISRRTRCPIAVLGPPGSAEIAWRETMTQTLTRVPQGVLRCSTLEAANADRTTFFISRHPGALAGMET